MDDALIKSEVFGPKTLSTVLSGGHYVRSFKGMLIVSEVLDCLMWSAFWTSNDHESHPFLQSAIELEIFCKPNGELNVYESLNKFPLKQHKFV